MNVSSLLLMLPVITLNVAANIMLKLGSSDTASPILLGILSWRTLLGLFLFGSGGVVYALVLKYLPLSIAQMVASLQYVMTVMVAVFFMGEILTILQFVGMVCIAVGIVCIVIPYS